MSPPLDSPPAEKVGANENRSQDAAGCLQQERWFGSGFLQRRVRCEPDFLDYARVGLQPTQRGSLMPSSREQPAVTGDYIVLAINQDGTLKSNTLMLLAICPTLDRKIQMREYGRMANMADPFGNGFDLIEFSGPGYDNVTG